MAGEEDFDPEHTAPDQFMAKNRAQKIFTLLMGPADESWCWHLALIIGVTIWAAWRPTPTSWRSWSSATSETTPRPKRRQAAARRRAAAIKR